MAINIFGKWELRQGDEFFEMVISVENGLINIKKGNVGYENGMSKPNILNEIVYTFKFTKNDADARYDAVDAVMEYMKNNYSGRYIRYQESVRKL